MNISVLIPSRGNPKELVETFQSLIATAAQPLELEFIVRLDLDDPALADYLFEARHLGPAMRSPIILIGEPLGYARIHDDYEECYRLSSGKLILAFNDDMEMVTRHWDALYLRTLGMMPYGVASATVNEGNGTNYGWAMPMVDRRLCEAAGRLCPGTETCDRVFDAYARLSGRGMVAPVTMNHKWQPPKPGSERERVYNYACSHWGEMSAKWDASAQGLIRAMSAKILSGHKDDLPHWKNTI